MRELCEDVAGGLIDGHEIKALQIGGPLGGILPASLLDTPFDFDDLAAVGCMLGHGGIVAFDETTDMRALATHLLHFGAAESCGKCFPCRIGLRRAHEMFASGAPVDRASLEALLETLELGSLCAHGGGNAGTDPQPAGTLSGGARTRMSCSQIEIDGAPTEVAPGTTVLEAVRALGDDVADALLRRAPGAVRRLPRLPGRRRRRARRRSPPARRCAATGWWSTRATPTARRIAAATVELVLSELPGRARPRTPSWRAVAHWFEHRSRRAALARRAARARPRRAPPLPRAAARAVHLLRALRARLRRDPGRVRADRHRPRLQANIAAGLDQGFRDSTCVSCGACADTCPTDAITEISLLAMAER